MGQVEQPQTGTTRQRTATVGLADALSHTRLRVALAAHVGVLLVVALLGEADLGLPSGARPWVVAMVVLVAIIATAALAVLTWRSSAAIEAERAQVGAATEREAVLHRHQQELASVYATAARRSQGLLERQLEIIEQLEADADDPAVLEKLFSLDHLSTRMSREAVSMLVLAGGEPNRRVTGTPPLSEVVRGAIGEVEDYTRVDLDLEDDREVDGRVVAAVVHVLSELIENAASYSPPDKRVVVHGCTTSDGGVQLRVIDRGIGLDDARLHEYNHLLANPPTTTPVDSQRLGLGVVARLAGRLAIPVQLSHNTDGHGVSATVQLPSALLSPASSDALSDAPDPDPIAIPVPQPALPHSAPAPAAGAPAPGPVEPAPAAGPAGATPASPRWASATAQAGSAGGTAPTSPASAPAADVAPAAAAPAAPRPVGAHATARSASSWSYGGHLQRRPEPTAAEEASEQARRRFGRGSRSQVAGVAPRTPVESTPMSAAPAADHTPPADTPPTPSTAPAPVRRSPTPGDLLPDPAAVGRGARAEPTEGTPRPTIGAPADPTPEAPQGWAASTQREDEVGDPPRPRPVTAAELLEGVGETPSAASEWTPRPRREIGREIGTAAPAASTGSEPPSTGSPGITRRSRPMPATPARADAPAAPETQAAPQVPSSTGAPPAAPPGGDAVHHQDPVRMRTGGELPQRRRGESLPEGLRGTAGPEPQRSASAAPVSREESRSLLSSYQSRLQAGRKAAEDQVARSRPASPSQDAGGATDGEAGSNDTP